MIADEIVEKYLKGKSFIAESVRQFGIEIKRVTLEKEVHNSVLKAQTRQIMINKN